MKNYNYKYVVIPGKKVIAISTYAGRTVKGVAKCHPNDTFDVEFGKKLAAARCNEKISYKRFTRALNKYKETIDESLALDKKIVQMRDYVLDASAAHEEAQRVLMELA